MEENFRGQAERMYEVICSALTKKGWNFAKKEENLQVIFAVDASDFTFSVGIGVEERKQRIYLQSPFVIEVNEDKRMEMAIAVCETNSVMPDGCIEYDIAKGTLGFRISASLWDSKAGEGLIEDLIGSAFAVVDKYTKKFEKLNKGEISIKEFSVIG